MLPLCIDFEALQSEGAAFQKIARLSKSFFDESVNPDRCLVQTLYLNALNNRGPFKGLAVFFSSVTVIIITYYNCLLY